MGGLFEASGPLPDTGVMKGRNWIGRFCCASCRHAARAMGSTAGWNSTGSRPCPYPQIRSSEHSLWPGVVPKARLKIAQRFIAGYGGPKQHGSPEGTMETRATSDQPSLRDYSCSCRTTLAQQ